MKATMSNIQEKNSVFFFGCQSTSNPDALLEKVNALVLSHTPPSESNIGPHIFVRIIESKSIEEIRIIQKKLITEYNWSIK